MSQPRVSAFDSELSFESVNPMRIQLFLAVAAASLAVVTTPRPAHAATKPCDLLSSQDATALLQTPVKPLLQMDRYCGYQYISDKVNTNLGLSLSSAGAANAATLNKLAGKGDTTETIADLGDANILIGKDRDLYTLTVIYHGQLLSLAASKRQSPELKAAVIQEMRVILAKI